MNKDNHNDFENQGWEAMLQTLDRELPVKKKRRRLLWLVFFISLTATLGGGSWYWHTKSAVKTIDKTISKPIVDTDSHKNTEGGEVVELHKNNKTIENKSFDTHINDLSVNKNNKTIENKSVETHANDLSFNKNNKTIENKSVETYVNDLSVIKNSKTIENKSVETYVNDLSINKNNKSVEKNKNDLSVNDNKKNDFTSFESLGMIHIAPLSIEQDTNLKIEPEPFFKTIKCFTGISKKLRLGITTGIHTEKGQKIDGFQAGLVVFKPLTYHWSLGTGLNFRQTQTSGNPISYFKTENLLNAASTTNLQSGKPISLDKLYYLELPLVIQYQFKKIFAFSTGLKTAYLVGQSVKANGASVYFVSGSFTSKDNNAFINQVNTTTLGLNRWDVSLLGGFSYLPTQHIQLGLRYDLGFMNIINRTNWSAYNRYVGLNVVYLF